LNWGTLGIWIKWDFLGLNGIDFLDLIGLNPKNQSHLIPKKSHLIQIPTSYNSKKYQI
jgi:hypothetical protein